LGSPPALDDPVVDEVGWGARGADEATAGDDACLRAVERPPGGGNSGGGGGGGFIVSTLAANCGSLRLRIRVRCMSNVCPAKGSPARRSKSGLKNKCLESRKSWLPHFG